MKLIGIFLKTLKEQRRDPLMLVLSLIFAPFLVLAYAAFLPSGSTAYTVLVLNQDVPVQLANGRALSAGEGVIEALQGLKYSSGSSLLDVRAVSSRAEAETPIKNRDAELLVIIPPDFSQAIRAAMEGNGAATTPITFRGDLTNPYYALALVLSNAALDEYIQSAAQLPRIVEIAEEAVGASGARTEFEIYIPGLLIFAMTMMMFLAAMAIAREVEAGTLRCLQITPMTSLDLLGGISAAMIMIGVAQVILAFFTAQAFGFHSQGPLWIAILVAAVTSLSVVGVGLLIAAFSHSQPSIRDRQLPPGDLYVLLRLNLSHPARAPVRARRARRWAV